MQYLLRLAVAGCFVVPATAHVTPPWISATLPVGTVLPRAINEHSCFNQYPEKAKADRIEGITALDFQIGDDGRTKGVTTRKSSGNAMLDQAAVGCVQNWIYEPAKQGDKAIEVSWRTEIKWVLTALPLDASQNPSTSSTSIAAVLPPRWPQSTKMPTSTGAPHMCIEDYPLDALIEHQQGITTIGMFINVDGHTDNVHVVISSGFYSLDEAAVNCARRWEYVPASLNGKQIRVPWKAEVRWIQP